MDQGGLRAVDPGARAASSPERPRSVLYMGDDWTDELAFERSLRARRSRSGSATPVPASKAAYRLDDVDDGRTSCSRRSPPGRQRESRA